MSKPDLVIVGPAGNTHISGSLAHAGGAVGLSCMVVDTARAYAGPRLPRALLWHWGGRRPYRLRTFSDRLRGELSDNPPQWLVALGHAPITAEAIRALRDLGV